MLHIGKRLPRCGLSAGAGQGMNPDIVIVGAGAAGIGAGLELQDRGIPFMILEAADRVDDGGGPPG